MSANRSRIGEHFLLGSQDLSVGAVKSSNDSRTPVSGRWQFFLRGTPCGRQHLPACWGHKGFFSFLLFVQVPTLRNFWWNTGVFLSSLTSGVSLMSTNLGSPLCCRVLLLWCCSFGVSFWAGFLCFPRFFVEWGKLSRKKYISKRMKKDEILLAEKKVIRVRGGGGEEEREIDQNSLQDKIVVMPWRP